MWNISLASVQLRCFQLEQDGCFEDFFNFFLQGLDDVAKAMWQRQPQCTHTYTHTHTHPNASFQGNFEGCVCN